MKRAIFLLIMIFLSAGALANESHLKLLAVSGEEGNHKGMVADLYLEIRQGAGHVYIDTFPLTKVDTQISTRFAKEVVCNELNLDCSSYDFFYTIRSGASIIGGPSAGAAIAALTYAELSGFSLDESITITGTINSGSMVGVVGGLKEKIAAASKKNLVKVIIPSGTRFAEEENNTIDLFEFGESKNVTIVEAVDLYDVLYEFTGKNFGSQDTILVLEDGYKNTMSFLAKDLCGRSSSLNESLSKQPSFRRILQNETFNNTWNSAINLTKRAAESFEDRFYYSSASYCFGANLKLRNLILEAEQLNKSGIETYVTTTRLIWHDFNRKIDSRSYKTITDLQAYMIVKERLLSVEDFLNRSTEKLKVNNTHDVVYNLAYAMERLYSARSWSAFFEKNGTEFDFDDNVLRASCISKLSEAEERLQYLKLYFPDGLKDTRKTLDTATSDYKNNDYELCLFRASKAKAESNLVLNSLGVSEDQIDTVIENKIKIARKSIVKQQNKGLFPILGYSYYEYSESLKEIDKYSSMLYAEYALELSNLDIYLEEKEKPAYIFTLAKQHYFFIGILVGFAIASLIYNKLKNK